MKHTNNSRSEEGVAVDAKIVSLFKGNIDATEVVKVRKLIEEAVLEAQLGLIEYFDQAPTNDSMDWKALFTDARNLLKQNPSSGESS